LRTQARWQNPLRSALAVDHAMIGDSNAVGFEIDKSQDDETAVYSLTLERDSVAAFSTSLPILRSGALGTRSANKCTRFFSDSVRARGIAMVGDSCTMRINDYFWSIVIWLMLSMLFFIIGCVTSDLQKYYRLAKHEAVTMGTVVRKDPENHFAVEYIYEVDGHGFGGSSGVKDSYRSFEALEVGGPIRVFYDRESPENSVLVDPNSYLNSLLGMVAFLTILGPLFFMFGMYRKGWLSGPSNQH
jgi:hypothetical protein